MSTSIHLKCEDCNEIFELDTRLSYAQEAWKLVHSLSAISDVVRGLQETTYSECVINVYIDLPHTGLQGPILNNFALQHGKHNVQVYDEYGKKIEPGRKE